MRLVTYDRIAARAPACSTANVSSMPGTRSAGTARARVRELLAADRLAIWWRRSTAPKASRLSTTCALAADHRTPRRSSASASTTARTPRRRSRRSPTSRRVFAKFRNALAAPGAMVDLPKASEKVDYEAEVCVVIGAALKEVDEDEALAGVAGYMLMNDLSARDLQLATSQWISGKIVRRRRALRPGARRPPTRPGPRRDRVLADTQRREMQASSTADLIFSVPRARRPPLEADDARARRPDLDRHAVRRGHRAPAERLAEAGRRGRVSSPQLGVCGRRSG